MKLVRAIAASGPGRIVFALLVAYCAWQAWLRVAAPGKVAAELRGQPRVNVLVTLAFVPERFHVLEMQRYGRVSGTEDTGIELRGVTADNLDAVARPYWVRHVGPME